MGAVSPRAQDSREPLAGALLDSFTDRAGLGFVTNECQRSAILHQQTTRIESVTAGMLTDGCACIAISGPAGMSSDPGQFRELAVFPLHQRSEIVADPRDLVLSRMGRSVPRAT